MAATFHKISTILTGNGHIRRAIVLGALVALALLLAAPYASADNAAGTASRSTTITANIIVPLKWQLIVAKILELKRREQAAAQPTEEPPFALFTFSGEGEDRRAVVSADGVPSVVAPQRATHIALLPTAEEAPIE